MKIICDECGTITYKTPRQIGKAKKHFCSNTCHYKYRKRTGYGCGKNWLINTESKGYKTKKQRETKERMKDLYKVLLPNSKHFNNKHMDQLYNEYFYMNWLRPETALYYFSLAKAMYKFSDYFSEPIMDFGCGDGTFLTTFFGGTFDKTIDSYMSVDLTKKDIYDNYIKPKKPIVLEKPSKIIYGIDNRENVVKSALSLNIYAGIRTGDIKNTKYKDRSMGTVYCNMINDIKTEELTSVFKEIYRVLDDNGFVIFTTPVEDFLDCLYYKKSIWEPRTIAFWKRFLKTVDFQPVTFEPFMDKKLLNFWDTGFRPYFKQLMELKKILQYKKTLPEFKNIWVEILKNYFFEYVSEPLEGKIGFVLIVARKEKR